MNMLLTRAVTSIGLWMAASSAARADAVYTNAADFVTAIGVSQSFLNEFSDLTDSEQLVHPLNYSSNGIAYSITSLPLLYLQSLTGAVSTVNPSDGIQVTFTSGNVRAAGGWFYLVNSNAAPAGGSVSVTFSNGAAMNVTNSFATPPPLPFIGFISTRAGLASLTIHSGASGVYPALDHLYAAEGIPEMSVAPSAGSGLRIDWPAPGTGYTLQSSPQLSGLHWTNVAVLPQQVGDQMQVTVPVSARQMFYRLQKQ